MISRIEGCCIPAYALEDCAFASHALQRVTPRKVQMRQMNVPQSEQG